MKVEVLTVVEDGNPSMEDAVAACVAWINAGRIEQYASGSAAMGMDGLTIYAIPGNRAVVVAKLTEMKYRIVEGGQL